MKKFKLKNGVFSCLSDGCLIFLDSNSMNYIQLDKFKTKIFLDEVNDRNSTRERALKILEIFFKNNLIVYDESGDGLVLENDEIKKIVNSSYAYSFIKKRDLKIKDFFLVFIINSYVRFKFKYFKDPLPQKNKINENTVINTDDVVNLVGLYNSLITFLPWGNVNKCLLKSIGLKYYLKFHGYNSDLVIGVKANPFYAHAWLQINEQLLNDELEYVGVYNPILRIS